MTLVSEVFDFIPSGEADKWGVYAKNSTLSLGHVAWSDAKKRFDYFPNANASLMGILKTESYRADLQKFCQELTEERQEQGGNKQ